MHVDVAELSSCCFNASKGRIRVYARFGRRWLNDPFHIVGYTGSTNSNLMNLLQVYQMDGTWQ